MLTLFPDEQIVTQSSDNSVTLTTHRICNEQREWGNTYNQSIMLEHITSCENHATRNIILYVLAAAAAVLGIIKIEQGGIVGILIGVILVLIYQKSKKNIIIIGSPSTKMVLNVAGMKREKVLAFINKVEQAKHKRLLHLSRVTANS